MSRSWAILLFFSGAAALCGEIVWMRRLALQTGSTGVALTVTLSGYMLGLGIGAAIMGTKRFLRPQYVYAGLEWGSALWLLALPSLLALLQPGFAQGGTPATLLAFVVVIPPGLLHGATLPALASGARRAATVGGLYAANTAGAVVGVGAATFLLLPTLGLRGTELTAAGLAVLAGLGACGVQDAPAGAALPLTSARPSQTPRASLLMVCVAGGTALGLEVIWGRVAALLLGSSVYAAASVLAIFLLGIAAGAHFGRSRDVRSTGPALMALGAMASIGVLSWRWLPHAMGLAWDAFGEDGQLASGALLLALTMGGAPFASGVVFTTALHIGHRSLAGTTGATLAANTTGSVVGAALTGLVLIPEMGLRDTALLLATTAVGTGFWFTRRRLATWIAGGFLASVLLSPAWDPALYAVGLGLRMGEFVDLSPRAIERFAHEGWTLRFARDGKTASVAVGESNKTGNRWLSINGKVDASTGDDMPTQIWSGRLPVLIYRAIQPEAPPTVAVVGLASGVTAGSALDAGASHVDVIELEPRVIEAATWFSHVNHDVLNDPRATIHVADARAFFARSNTNWDVIVSEPSNPWITGVSNLFTEEYWRIGKRRLNPNGVFVQWVQLYALPPNGFRSIVRSFTEVFPEAYLFETIPGSDALLIAVNAADTRGADWTTDLPLVPTLQPNEVSRLGAWAQRNTDDQPWIEFEAPRWLHRQTGSLNQALILGAQRSSAKSDAETIPADP